MGIYAFDACQNLKYIKLPSGTKRIKEGVLWLYNLEELVIPYGVTYIESFNAWPTGKLRSLEVPTTVLGGMESYYDMVTDITINYGDKDISDIGYEQWLQDISKIRGANKDKVVNGYVKNNTGIKQVKGAVKNVMATGGTLTPAFSENIKEYTLKLSKEIDKVTLGLIAGNNATVSKNVTTKLEIGESETVELVATDKFGETSIYSVKIVRERYTSENAFDFSYGRITGYRGTSGDVVIPPTINGVKVTEIGSNAFKNNTTIRSLEIPYGVTYINSSAFEGCTNLEKLEVPSTVTYCSSWAFSNCNSLKKVTINYGDKDISSIGINEFNNFISNSPGLGGINIFNITDGYIKNNSAIKCVKGSFDKEDVNRDGIVDILDIAMVANKYNKTNEDSEWNGLLDINNDAIIDIYDIILVSKVI